MPGKLTGEEQSNDGLNLPRGDDQPFCSALPEGGYDVVEEVVHERALLITLEARSLRVLSHLASATMVAIWR